MAFHTTELAQPPFADSKWDRIELSDDEDNFHPNIDNNLMIRLQREKRQQREAEDEEKRKKLQEENSEAAKAELERMERTKKLNIGNICTDKFVSTHEKSTASESANPIKGKKDAKLQVAASNEETFVEGYEEFLQENRPLLIEYAAIDEEDEKSEQFILTNTQLLSEHATGFCDAAPELPPPAPPAAERPTDHSRCRRPAALHQPAGRRQDPADAEDCAAVPAAHLRVRPRQVDAWARCSRRYPAAVQKDGLE